MTLERIAAITLGLVITSTASAAQSGSGRSNEAPASLVIQRIPASGITPSRVVQTRTAAGDREVLVETIEAPSVDGRMSPIQETSVETIRAGSVTTQTRRDVFAVAADGRRTLLRTTQTQQDTMPNGDTTVVHSTMSPDLDGRVAVTSRQIEQVRSVTPDTRQTTTTTLAPDPNLGLAENARTEETEQRTASGVRSDLVESVRDVNDRWQPHTTRTGEVRQLATGRVEEQTVQRSDLNGRLTVVERTASRGSSSNDREDAVTETYLPLVDRSPESGGGLALSERVSQTTTRTRDGGRSTIEEVEGRNPAAPGDPMRVMRRTVTTVRAAGPDRWITEREVFERDVNGRMQRVLAESEESTGK